MLPDGYIRRNTSTIPFGYEYDEITGLKPIERRTRRFIFCREYDCK